MGKPWENEMIIGKSPVLIGKSTITRTKWPCSIARDGDYGAGEFFISDDFLDDEYASKIYLKIRVFHCWCCCRGSDLFWLSRKSSWFPRVRCGLDRLRLWLPIVLWKLWMRRHIQLWVMCLSPKMSTWIYLNKLAQIWKNKNPPGVPSRSCKPIGWATVEHRKTSVLEKARDRHAKMSDTRQQRVSKSPWFPRLRFISVNWNEK